MSDHPTPADDWMESARDWADATRGFDENESVEVPPSVEELQADPDVKAVLDAANVMNPLCTPAGADERCPTCGSPIPRENERWTAGKGVCPDPFHSTPEPHSGGEERWTLYRADRFHFWQVEPGGAESIKNPRLETVEVIPASEHNRLAERVKEAVSLMRHLADQTERILGSKPVRNVDETLILTRSCADRLQQVLSEEEAGEEAG